MIQVLYKFINGHFNKTFNTFYKFYSQILQINNYFYDFTLIFIHLMKLWRLTISIVYLHYLLN